MIRILTADRQTIRAKSPNELSKTIDRKKPSRIFKNIDLVSLKSRALTFQELLKVKQLI